MDKKTRIALPVFNGFYNTIFGIDDFDIKSLYDDNLSDNENKKLYNWDLFNYEKYMAEVAKNCVRSIGFYLANMGIAKSTDYVEILSPKEYNFCNDRIYVDMDIDRDGLCVLFDKHYDNFGVIVKEELKQRSGFIPYYSNDIKDWSVDFMIENTACLRLFLEYILKLENENIYIEMYEDCEHHSVICNALM